MRLHDEAGYIDAGPLAHHQTPPCNARSVHTLGQVQTNVMGRKLVRSREISRRPTSAFARRPKLSRTISASGGKADALEGGRFRPSLATTGHVESIEMRLCIANTEGVKNIQNSDQAPTIAGYDTSRGKILNVRDINQLIIFLEMNNIYGDAQSPQIGMSNMEMIKT